jgi:4-diphosphocytidyl-2-C-methyl-D-erythritol kinase
MIVFPNSKINIGLKVVRKRNDGFHDIETIFYPLPVRDALEIIPAKNNFEFTHSGLSLNNISENNLCVKAYLLLKKDFSQLPPVQMHLHKAIPVGAGLGGGSADGAFTLLLLNKKFNLGLSAEQLQEYALQLGSDCPFFILNTACFATSRGEFLEPVKLDLSAFKVLLVHPGIHVSTAWAFSVITPTVSASFQLKDIITRPIESWKDFLKNDFEEPVFKKFPEIEKIKNSLYESGAVFSAMSGSGSSVFGIFRRDTAFTNRFPAHYFVKELPGRFQ